jgi:hypothetical protein
MTVRAPTADQSLIITKPYTPSWTDQLTAWIEGLPGNSLLYYALLAALLLLAQVIIQWQSGQGLKVEYFWIALASTVPYHLALIHYLDRVAEEALKRFKPGLNCTEAEFQQLRYRLTTMPAGPSLLACVVTLIIGLLVMSAIPFSLQMEIAQSAVTQTAVIFNQIMILASFTLVGNTAYHTWHQLRMVSHIYNQYTNVDLFNLRPLYAFSDLSARTAIGLLVITYNWIVTSPVIARDPVTSSYTIFWTVASALTFVFPLIGIHNLLTARKDHYLVEIGERLKAVVAELHRRVDGQEIRDMDNLNKAVASLEITHTAVKRVPTWPWQPETIRAVLAAVFFPIIVWLTQWILQRFMMP